MNGRALVAAAALAAVAAAGSVTLPAIIYDIAVAGTVAYAAMDFDGLATVDVSDPAAPAALTTYSLPGPPRDVAVSGARVLVAVAGAELGGSGDPGVHDPPVHPVSAGCGRGRRGAWMGVLACRAPGPAGARA